MTDDLHSLRHSDSVELDAGFHQTEIVIGGEKYCYLMVPSPGCRKIPRCIGCAFRDTGTPGLQLDEQWRQAVMRHVDFCLETGAQALVFLNNGDMLDPGQMNLATLLEHVPQAVAKSSSCQRLEIEIGVGRLGTEDARKQIDTIRRNLSGKPLVVRVAVEHADDVLLSRMRKGVTVEDTTRAIEWLTSNGIPWIGYALLGGVTKTSAEAVQAAIHTGMYIIDHGAHMLSINGFFETKEMREAQERTGEEMYVPSMEDLRSVLQTLCAHRADRAYPTLIKVGMEEETAALRIVRYPYGIPTDDTEVRREMMALLGDFNNRQSLSVFDVGDLQRQARATANRQL